jgi:hypothetical protein
VGSYRVPCPKGKALEILLFYKRLIASSKRPGIDGRPDHTLRKGNVATQPAITEPMTARVA